MKKTNKINKKVPKWMYWTPRIASIVMLLFLAIFSFDVFEEGLGFWGTALGLFMHNLPVIILAVVLWISWKREIVGGIAFILAGLLHITWTIIKALNNLIEFYTLPYSLIIDGPLFAIGILFLMNWKRKKKRKENKK